MCRVFLTVIAIGLVAGVYAADDDPKPLTAQEIQDLANKLGDIQFSVRDAASKRLDRMGAAELEAFRKLDLPADLEMKRAAHFTGPHVG